MKKTNHPLNGSSAALVPASMPRDARPRQLARRAARCFRHPDWRRARLRKPAQHRHAREENDETD